MELKPNPTDSYQGQSGHDVAKALQCDLTTGLDQQDVERRRQYFGFNEVSSQEEALWHRVLRRFWGPIPWMIEVAAILSALVGKWHDFLIIAVMLLVNAGLDFLQEHRALNALKALRQRLTTDIMVLREGRFTSISIKDLVPGDVIKLRTGNVVPADVLLFDGDYLSLDESALTGESLPVNKTADDVAYAGTIVKQGEMKAIVVNTGTNTNFHGVVALVAKASLEERSHFQKMVIRVGDFLIAITVALVMVIVIVGLFRNEHLLDIARFALVLTVAGIPVALPAVLSVTMAVGAINLSRRQAIVSRLTAIEELAGVDVFCSDKTGTLTCNQMQIAEPVVFNGHSVHELYRVAALASRPENADPIEQPIFNRIREEFQDSDWETFEQVTFIPFDPIRKRTEARVQRDGQQFTAVKGAPQVILALADLDGDQLQDILQVVESLAADGYRTLGVGYQKDGETFEFLGLIPLYDPPRADSRQVIDDMYRDGVEVKMITGDNLAIARQIGSRLGLTQRSLSASQLTGSASNELLTLASALSAAIYHKLKPEVDSKAATRFANDVIDHLKAHYDTSLLDKEFIHTHESAIVEMIESVSIFAEVVPQDKYRIVDTLQKAGHVVAMTGDGVNDAPALKKADCGIAVSNATDAARAAADIILTAPGLGVINQAIKEARITFERMKSYSIFRITETIRIVLFMTLCILVFDFYPMTALMIILLALLNDLPILAIAYDHTKVNSRPVRWNMPAMLTVASVLGVSGVIGSFMLFYLLKEADFSEPVIQTMLFLKLIVAGHSTLYLTRSEGWFWEKPYPAPLLMTTIFATEIAGTLIAVYGVFVTPIGWEYALWMWAYALVWMFINNAVKMVTYRRLHKLGMT